MVKSIAHGLALSHHPSPPETWGGWPAYKTYVLQHPFCRGNKIDLFARHFADPRPCTTARARLIGRGDIVFDAHTWQGRVDRHAFSARTNVLGNDSLARLSFALGLCAKRFSLVEKQIGMAEAAELFGRRRELLVCREPQLLFEDRDQRRLRCDGRVSLGEPRFQGSDLIARRRR
jgi:hypothetical protein